MTERYCAWCKDPYTNGLKCAKCGAVICDEICMDAHRQAQCQKEKRWYVVGGKGAQ